MECPPEWPPTQLFLLVFYLRQHSRMETIMCSDARRHSALIITTLARHSCSAKDSSRGGSDYTAPTSGPTTAPLPPHQERPQRLRQVTAAVHRRSIAPISFPNARGIQPFSIPEYRSTFPHLPVLALTSPFPPVTPVRFRRMQPVPGFLGTCVSIAAIHDVLLCRFFAAIVVRRGSEKVEKQLSKRMAQASVDETIGRLGPATHQLVATVVCLGTGDAVQCAQAPA